MKADIRRNENNHLKMQIEMLKSTAIWKGWGERSVYGMDWNLPWRLHN